MTKLTGKYSPHLYAALRIVAGLMFFLHGLQILTGFPEPLGVSPLPPMLLAAGIIELVCGALIAVGFFASYAAFLASGQMAFAYFIAHSPKGLWPTLNGGEPAVLYCFLFLYIAAQGPGIWSVNRK